MVFEVKCDIKLSKLIGVKHFQKLCMLGYLYFSNDPYQRYMTAELGDVDMETVLKRNEGLMSVI